MASLAYRQATGQTTAPERATPATAFQAASEAFLRGERLDMSALATELGVSRATLYRWTGDREQLLADIIWTQLDAIIADAAARVRGVGQKRLERIAARFLDVLANAPALRAHLVNDGETGLRLMIAPNGLLRPRVVGRVRELVEQEVERGYRPPAPPAVLADGIVSICERYLHNGGDPSLNPDPATAQRIIALLLREEPKRR